MTSLSSRRGGLLVPAAPEPEIREDAEDGVVVVEAVTARDALEELTSSYGPDVDILEVETVQRGGIGGFFAREMVQIRARPGADHGGAAQASRPERPAGADAAASTTPPESDDRVVPSVLARLREVDEQERTFGDVLREQLTRASHAASPAPARGPEPPAAPAPDAQAAPRPPATPLQVSPPTRSGGHPDWRPTNLLRLGLPSGLVNALGDIDPTDDAGWISALASAVAPYCAAHLPPAAYVGPRAARLAEDLGVPVVSPPDDVRTTGSFCAKMRDTQRNRAWLAWVREDRPIHLVVGGSGWRELLFDEPVALSWVGPDAVPDALRFAVDLRLPLGLGVGRGRSAPALPADPVEIALAVRDLLPAR